MESRPIQLKKSLHEQLKDRYSPQKRASYAQTKTIDSESRGSGYASIEAARSHAGVPLGTEAYKIGTKGSEKDNGGDYGPTNGFQRVGLDKISRESHKIGFKKYSRNSVKSQMSSV